MLMSGYIKHSQHHAMSSAHYVILFHETFPTVTPSWYNFTKALDAYFVSDAEKSLKLLWVVLAI